MDARLPSGRHAPAGCSRRVLLPALPLAAHWPALWSAAAQQAWAQQVVDGHQLGQVAAPAAQCLAPSVLQHDDAESRATGRCLHVWDDHSQGALTAGKAAALATVA